MKIENKKTYFRNYGVLSFTHFASLLFQYFLYYVGTIFILLNEFTSKTPFPLPPSPPSKLFIFSNADSSSSHSLFFCFHLQSNWNSTQYLLRSDKEHQCSLAPPPINNKGKHLNTVCFLKSLYLKLSSLLQEIHLIQVVLYQTFQLSICKSPCDLPEFSRKKQAEFQRNFPEGL